MIKDGDGPVQTTPTYDAGVFEIDENDVVRRHWLVHHLLCSLDAGEATGDLFTFQVKPQTAPCQSLQPRSSYSQSVFPECIGGRGGINERDTKGCCGQTTGGGGHECHHNPGVRSCGVSLFRLNYHVKRPKNLSRITKVNPGFRCLLQNNPRRNPTRVFGTEAAANRLKYTRIKPDRPRERHLSRTTSMPSNQSMGRFRPQCGADSRWGLRRLPGRCSETD